MDNSHKEYIISGTKYNRLSWVASQYLPFGAPVAQKYIKHHMQKGTVAHDACKLMSLGLSYEIFSRRITADKIAEVDCSDEVRSMLQAYVVSLYDIEDEDIRRRAIISTKSAARWFRDKEPNVFSCEETVKMGTVAGTPDLIVNNEDGTKTVVDFKTTTTIKKIAYPYLMKQMAKTSWYKVASGSDHAKLVFLDSKHIAYHEIAIDDADTISMAAHIESVSTSMNWYDNLKEALKEQRKREKNGR